MWSILLYLIVFKNKMNKSEGSKTSNISTHNVSTHDNVFDAIMFTEFLRSKGIACVAVINGSHCDHIYIDDQLNGNRFHIRYTQCENEVPLQIERLPVISDRKTHVKSVNQLQPIKSTLCQRRASVV